jgi:hypothetical protein
LLEAPEVRDASLEPASFEVAEVPPNGSTEVRMAEPAPMLLVIVAGPTEVVEVEDVVGVLACYPPDCSRFSQGRPNKLWFNPAP